MMAEEHWANIIDRVAPRFGNETDGTMGSLMVILEVEVKQEINDAVEEADKGWCLGCNQRGGECRCAEMGGDAEWVDTAGYVKQRIAEEHITRQTLYIADKIKDAVEDESEACAKMCDNRGQVADNIAAAIRGRK